jgi:hypothetical protein
VGGDAIIRGALTVTGNITAVNQTEINIEDVLISLGKTASPSNDTADTGGFLIEAGSDLDKTFRWYKDTGADATGSWISSEHMNVAAGKAYHVNGFSVLSQTSLGVTVASAPGLTSIGTLSLLQVDNININGSTISYVNSQQTNGSITIAPQGNGVIGVSSARITDLALAVDPTDAASLETVTTAVEAAPLGLSADTTGLNDDQVGLLIITKIYPVAEHQPDTKCRLWAINTSTAKLYSIRNGVWSFDGDIT